MADKGVKRAQGAERQRRFAAEMRRAGLVQTAVWVPAHVVPDLRLAAEIIRQNRHLTIGPLRDPVSGRLVRLKA